MSDAPTAGTPPPLGWVRVDCHLHTVDSGDAVTTLDQLAARVAEERLDVVCVTDHNVTSAAVNALERGIGARVVVGEEIRTSTGEVIGLFLTSRIPYVLPIGEVVDRIRAQGGIVYIPHPYDATRSSVGPALADLCAAGRVDAIEVFNAKIADPALNARAAEEAARWNLPGGAGSDAHDPVGIGAAYVELPDFDGPADFLASLHQAHIFGEFRPHAPRYVPRAPSPSGPAGPSSPAGPPDSRRWA